MESMICKYLDSINISYNMFNIKAYCDTQRSQASIVSDIVRSIAKSIRFQTQFELPTNKNIGDIK